ncbi:hypothetical protein [Haliscomenobacter sp.]|uniref:hypothetical protein n=1 Tax=Haliscomenobacter sp. TaxID=2717303 RepID=UPI003BACF189
MLQNRRGLVMVQPQNMVNAPTVTPISSPNGANQAVIETSPFFSILVDTTDSGITTPTKIVIFDAAQGYQLINGYAMPLAVKIDSLTDHYQFTLNDIAHVGASIDIMKMTVNDKTKAGAQYGRKLEIFESSRGTGCQLVKTIFPEMGVSEQQYQENINTFDVNMIVTHRTAFVYTQEPGIKCTLSFYQNAEFGRQR